MSTINLIKTSNNTLQGSLEEDQEKLSKWSVGEILQAEVKKPRNIHFHRKFFAFLHVVFENQDIYDDSKHLLNEMKLKAGVYDLHITTKGNTLFIPGSIAFKNMDDITFSIFYNKCIDIALKHFCKGSTKEEIETQVNIILAFT